MIEAFKSIPFHELTEALQNIQAFTRPSSAASAANDALRERGVTVTPADLKGSKNSLIKLLGGVDIVICAIYHEALLDQIPLAAAAKEAGVKRFVPCNFGTPGIRGIVWANDTVSLGFVLGYPLTILPEA